MWGSDTWMIPNGSPQPILPTKNFQIFLSNLFMRPIYITPPVGLRLNVAVNKMKGYTSIGIIVRDSEKCFLGACSFTQHIVVESKVDEAIAAR
jgi:hypothetical protein